MHQFNCTWLCIQCFGFFVDQFSIVFHYFFFDTVIELSKPDKRLTFLWVSFKVYLSARIIYKDGLGSETSRSLRASFRVSCFVRTLFLCKRSYWSEGTKVGHCLLYRFIRKRNVSQSGYWTSFSKRVACCKGRTVNHPETTRIGIETIENNL